MPAAPVPRLPKRVRYTTEGLKIPSAGHTAEYLMGAELNKTETATVVETLNHILELELAGLVRYLHYSFMVFGHNRIPIVAWLRTQADESQAHAVRAGEHITSLGGHP